MDHIENVDHVQEKIRPRCTIIFENSRLPRHKPFFLGFFFLIFLLSSFSYKRSQCWWLNAECTNYFTSTSTMIWDILSNYQVYKIIFALLNMEGFKILGKKCFFVHLNLSIFSKKLLFSWYFCSLLKKEFLPTSTICLIFLAKVYDWKIKK